MKRDHATEELLMTLEGSTSLHFSKSALWNWNHTYRPTGFAGGRSLFSGVKRPICLEWPSTSYILFSQSFRQERSVTTPVSYLSLADLVRRRTFDQVLL